MMTQSDQRRLLFDWNRTASDYPRDGTIHGLFEQQVDASPDAVALVFQNQSLTYRQLDVRANQLAHHLRRHGIGPDVMVGLCLHRGIEMVVGMLGTLKAGGVYVPLDPDYPTRRLAFMIDDTAAPVLLTQQDLSSKLPEHVGRVIHLDRDWPVIASEPADAVASGATWQNLAYVIYTSGSTGLPKGVSIPHRAVIRLVRETDYVSIESWDRIGQVSNSSFDAATFEVWAALLNGACLVGIPPAVVLAPRNLASHLREQRTTALFLTTALFNQVATEEPAAFSGVRQLLFGGETVDPESVRKVHGHCGPDRLLHVYGPTENTTFTTWHRVRDVPDGVRTIPIGRPISNTRVYVLDGQMQPVPVGTPGELYVGGDGLARDYLHNAPFTAQRYLPAPHSDEDGARLYRTGDRVRWLDDGTIEFLGRFDQQVKIRGYRIEPGEVEAAMGRHDSVREAVVMVRQKSPDVKHLVAYVVASPGSVASIEERRHELRRDLRQTLPEYMVPSAFVFLDALPLTPNGKVDRGVLPIPDRDDFGSADGYVPPRGETERVMAQIWADVLCLDRVGAHDNFFELGGHSLNATRIASQIHEVLSIDVPLAEIFDNAKLSDLADSVQKRLTTRRHDRSPITRAPRTGLLPLSHAQERVWFVQRLDPSNLAYHFMATIRFTGPLNVAALKRSLNEMIRRHEILRTTFAERDGRPIQTIHPAWKVVLPVSDRSDLPQSERDAEIERTVAHESRQTFDLSSLPLLRWRLLRLNDHEHVLVHVEHHIIHDGWSFNVFLHELVTLYRTFRSRGPTPLAEPVIQFADFACWQRRWNESAEAEAQEAYWKSRLADSPDLLELPYDRPRPAVQRHRGAAPRFELPLSLCRKLRDLGLREGTTLYMTMLSGLVALLHRYSGSQDVSIGTGIANRRLRQTEGLLGMLLNNVVLRTDISGDPSGRQLMHRVRRITLEAYANQDLPFERVVEAVRPQRSLSHNPLFQVMFGFHDAPMPRVDLDTTDIDLTLGWSNGSAKFDLNVIVIPHSSQRVGLKPGGLDDGLTLLWEYDTDLFDEDTINRMVDHYRIVLEGLVAEPEQRISQLPLMTDTERTVQRLQSKATKPAYADGARIHKLFERQVDRSPDAVALVFEDQTLTYRSLNERANRLANTLRRRGVGPEVMVGLCIHRSLEMVVGILGILKAGGAYLPLDPEYPKQRLAFMLEDADVRVILTTQSLVQELDEHADALICLDTDWDQIVKEDGENVDGMTTPQNLAYVIYTSGSTGKPKGTTVTHGNVTRLMAATESWFKFNPGDVWTLFHSYAFDFSVWEIWGALLYGGQLVVVPFNVSRDPDAFYQLMWRERVTVLNQTPSAFRQLMPVQAQASRGNAALSLRFVVFGGEALDISKLKPWIERHGTDSPRLINMYGITETTVHVTYHPVTEADTDASAHGSAIGNPIPDLQTHVSNRDLHHVPTGVAGEILVGGAGLARGYLNRPSFTAERFIPDPFNPDVSGSRLYRSGDLARTLRDGTLVFLGRIDHQVKIRGFRIELGEIETAMGRHDSVRDVVVHVVEELSGQKKLVAYVVPARQATPSNGELRRHLQQVLPDYMVPSAFVLLEALPLMPNGKVDYKSLPLPDGRGLSEHEYVAPKTPTQRTIAHIWGDLLSAKRIGIHDDFFELGGHSLLATQVISRLRDVFALDLPLSCVFEHRSVSDLATHVDTVAWAARGEPAPSGADGGQGERGEI